MNEGRVNKELLWSGYELRSSSFLVLLPFVNLPCHWHHPLAVWFLMWACLPVLVRSCLEWPPPGFLTHLVYTWQSFGQTLLSPLSCWLSRLLLDNGLTLSELATPWACTSYLNSLILLSHESELRNTCLAEKTPGQETSSPRALFTCP